MKGYVDPMENHDEVGPAAQRFYAPNQWPKPKHGDLTNFRPIVELYFQEMTKLAQKMFALFSSLLSKQNGCDKNFYKYDTPMSTFNLAHYPSSQNEGLGISDHTDWELFTLLYPSFFPIQVCKLNQNDYIFQLPIKHTVHWQF